MQRGWSVAACLIFAAASFSCGGGGAQRTATQTSDGASPGSDEATPVRTATADEAAILALLNHQRQLVGRKDWRALYDTLSPQQQATCAYDKFLAGANNSTQNTADFDVSRYDIQQLNVEVVGDRGLVTYVATYDGRVVGTATDAAPDIYVRIDGSWYDEIDSHPPPNC